MNAVHGEHTSIRAMCGRPGGNNGKVFELDVLFPKVLEGHVDTWSIDEGMAHLLTGFVRAVKPSMMLETGIDFMLC